MSKKQHGGRRKGAGRKPIHDEGTTRVVAITIPSSLVDQIDRLADQNGVTRSVMMTKLVRKSLPKSK